MVMASLFLLWAYVAMALAVFILLKYYYQRFMQGSSNGAQESQNLKDYKTALAILEQKILRYAIEEDRLIDCITMREWSAQEHAWYDVPDKHLSRHSITYLKNMVPWQEAAIKFSGAIDDNGEPKGEYRIIWQDYYPPYSVYSINNGVGGKEKLVGRFNERAQALIIAQHMIVESLSEQAGFMSWLQSGRSGKIFNSKGEYVYYPSYILEEASRLWILCRKK